MVSDLPTTATEWLWSALRWTAGILLAVVGSLGGWIAWEIRRQRNRLDGLEDSLAGVRVTLAERGMKLEGIADAMRAHDRQDTEAHVNMNERLNRMEDKIDRLLERGR